MVKPANGASSAGTMPASEMAAILGRILQRHGMAVLEDRRRTLGLLRDHAPSETRGVRLLMAAYDLDVPKNLAAEGGAPSQIRIEQEVNSLIADSGLQSDLARWAVNVWSAALSGGAPASAASPAVVAPEAVPPPSADDLTWDDEPAGVQVAPAAAAPSAVPPTAPAVAPSYAPPPSSAAPMGAAGLGSLAQKPMFRYGLIAAALILAVVGIKSFMGPSDDDGKPVKPSEPTVPAKPVAPSVVVASTSTNVSDWPEFSGAAHPNNDPNSWQFQFNLRFGDNRIIAYNVFVAMNGNGRAGTGSVRALDVRYLNGSAEWVSSTPSLSVSREFQSGANIFVTHVNTTAWTKNPSNAPNVCVIFSSGNQQRPFNPDKGAFCAFELQGNTCSEQKIGCGRL
jgi:hypothetical protein